MSLVKLPNELYMKVLDESHYEHGERVNSLCQLALTCRHLNRIATPALYSAFTMHDAVHNTHYLTDPRPAFLLRTLVGNPELGSHFKSIQLNEKHIEQWDSPMTKGKNGVKVTIYSDPEPNEPPKVTIFSTPDWALVEKAVHSLCEQPIWRFPAGQPTDVTTWGEFPNQTTWPPYENPQPTDLPYDKNAFAEDWIRCLRAGHHDTVYALLLSLTTGTTSLHIERWLTNWCIDGMPPARIVNDYVSQFMRAVAQAQRNAQAQEADFLAADPSWKGHMEATLLPYLRDVEVHHVGPESNMPIALVIPFLLPPSVEGATLVGLWDPAWFPTADREDGIECSQLFPRQLPVLSLKKLKMQRGLLDAVSLGWLIKCCPQLEWLSYGQYKQMMGFNQNTGEPEPPAPLNLNVSVLQPYLDSTKETLRYIDFAINAERDIRCWHFHTDENHIWDMWTGHFDFSQFEKLESIVVNCENFLDHTETSGVYQDFAAILPLRALKTLVIHNSGWTWAWDGVARVEGSETRLQRVAQSFVNMLQTNTTVLKKLVFVGQNDEAGGDLFDGPPLVVQLLKDLCKERGIELVYRYLIAETDDDEVRELEEGMMGMGMGESDIGIDEDDPDVFNFMNRAETDEEPDDDDDDDDDDYDDDAAATADDDDDDDDDDEDEEEDVDEDEEEEEEEEE